MIFIVTFLRLKKQQKQIIEEEIRPLNMFIVSYYKNSNDKKKSKKISGQVS